MNPRTERRPGNSADRQRRRRERRRAGLERVEVFLPATAFLKMVSAGFLRSELEDDPAARAAAVRKVVGDWAVTRDNAFHARRDIAALRRDGNEPDSVESDQRARRSEAELWAEECATQIKIQHRNENLKRAAQLLHCDGSPAAIAELVTAYRQFCNETWRSIRDNATCPASLRGTAGTFFFAAMRAWPAALTPTQLAAAIK